MSITNGTTESLRDVRRQRLLLEEKMRIKNLERSKRIMEAFYVDDWINQYVQLYDRYRDNNYLATPTSTINDRLYGRNYPMFQNEQELGLLRGPSRVLCATNTYAIGLLSGLTSYVIGTGYTHRVSVSPKFKNLEETKAKILVRRAQEVLDEFQERECWPEWEQELFWRSREDGEFFLRHFFDEGKTWVRTVEPEQVYQPPGGKVSEGEPLDWYFGIYTRNQDNAGPPLAYWIVYMTSPGEGDEVSAADMVHAKVNTRRSVKRGMPDFTFSTYDALTLADKLRRNVSEGAALQAAIAWVRQHENASINQVQNYESGLVDFTRTDGLTGRTVDTHKYQPGSILDVNQGQKYVDPPGAHNAEAHISVLQMCLRGAGVRWNAPEWLGSSDSSNNNFASGLVAESPFVKNVESAQLFYGRRFKRTDLIVLQNAVRAGELPPDAIRLLDIEVKPKSPESRNRLEEAQRNQIEIQTGYKSRQQASQEQGYDWEQTLQDNEEYEDRVGSAGLQLPEPGDNPFGQPREEKPHEVPAPKPPMPKPAAGELKDMQDAMDVRIKESLSVIEAGHGRDVARRVAVVAARLLGGIEPIMESRAPVQQPERVIVENRFVTEQKAQPAPIVNVHPQIDFHVPPQATPTLKIENTLNLPKWFRTSFERLMSFVTKFKMPKQEPPIVRVEPVIEVNVPEQAPPIVQVTTPEKEVKAKKVEFERDKNGNIIEARIKET